MIVFLFCRILDNADFGPLDHALPPYKGPVLVFHTFVRFFARALCFKYQDVIYSGVVRSITNKPITCHFMMQNRGTLQRH